MGFLPALRILSENAYIETHQKIDSFFAVRYPIYGNITLLVLVVLLVVVYRNRQRRVFAWTLAAFILFAANVAVAVIFCVPINQLVQTWTIENHPENWAQVQQQIADWHTLRAWLDIAAFGLFAVSYSLPMWAPKERMVAMNG